MRGVELRLRVWDQESSVGFVGHWDRFASCLRMTFGRRGTDTPDRNVATNTLNLQFSS